MAGVVEKQVVDLASGNAPAHYALSVKCYLATRGTPVLEHTLYSPMKSYKSLYLKNGPIKTY